MFHHGVYPYRSRQLRAHYSGHGLVVSGYKHITDVVYPARRWSASGTGLMLQRTILEQKRGVGVGGQVSGGIGV